MTEPRVEDRLETCWGRSTSALQAVCTHPSACKAASRCLASSSERGNVQPERKVPRRAPPDLPGDRRWSIKPRRIGDTGLDDLSNHWIWLPEGLKRVEPEPPIRPQIYDVTIDEMRDATQKDIDDCMRLRRAYGQLREALKRMMVETEEIHKRLMSGG